METRGQPRSIASLAASWLGALGLLSVAATAVEGQEPAARFEGAVDASIVGDGLASKRLELRLPDNQRGSVLLGETLGGALTDRGFSLDPDAALVLTFEFKRELPSEEDSPSVTLRGTVGSSSTPQLGARVTLPFSLWGDDDEARAKARAYVLTASVSDRDGVTYWRGRVDMVTDSEDDELIRRKMAAQLGADVGENVIGRRFSE